MAYLLGIDVATTGTKALLIDEKGNVVASATKEYPLSIPRPLWSEQDPSDWWEGTVVSIRELLEASAVDPAAIIGVGLTGQMHGLVLLDRRGQVLRPAILWNDQRTGSQCEWITETVGFERLLEWTGNLALPGFTAPKILWAREHEPAIYAQVAHILLPKDYIRYRLSGELATDIAGASGTLLLDVKRRDWSVEMLEALEIPAHWLPPCHEGPQVTGVVSPATSEETGLKVGTPIVGGGGDQAAQAVGVGAVNPGIVALTLGTSGVVFAPTVEPMVEAKGRLHAFCHAVPDRWHLMGVMLSAGGSLRWFRDALGKQEIAEATEKGVDAYEILLEGAKVVPVGSEGLLFLPYLTGERTPHADPLARGAFVGLTLRHSKAHLVRAVLEGVAYGLRDSLELLRRTGVSDPEQVRLSGGGARSPLWRQILADILGIELVTVNVTEGAAYGAALLAAVGAGIYTSVEEACETTVRILEQTSPLEEHQPLYNRYYSIYRSLYGALKPAYDGIAATQAV
ncbi:MAG: xylulokinase [Anaerolineae bacterium]